MNNLPAAKLASSAKNFLADALSVSSKKGANAFGAKNASASSNTNTPLLFHTKNAPASSPVKNAAKLAEGKKAPAAALAQDAATSAKVKDAPVSSVAKKALSFAEVLRQTVVEENTSSSRSQESRESAQGATQKRRQPESAAQAPSSARDAQSAARHESRQQAFAALQAAGYEAPPAHMEKAPQPFTPLEKAPATPHRVIGPHFQVGEVGFTQQELAKLRDKLLHEGLTPKSLTVFEQLASHPHGATLGQLMALVQGGAASEKLSLSDDDKTLLKNFADKIDTSGTLGKNLLQMLEEGRGKDAWDAIKSALTALSPQDSLVFGAGEAALLCKAFGISQEASLEVLKHFNNTGGLPLTPDFFTAIMLPAQQEIVDKFQQDAKLAQVLEKHLLPLINEARQRAEVERKATNGEDRKSKNSQTLLRDKIADKFHKHVAAPEKDETPPAARNAEAFSGRDEKTPAGKSTGKQADKRSDRHTSRQAEAPIRQDTRPGRTEELAAKAPLKPEEAVAQQDKNTNAATAAKKPEEAPVPQKPAAAQDAGTENDEGNKHAQRQRGESRGRENSGENSRDALRDSQALSRIEVREAAHTSDPHNFSSFAAPEQAQAQAAGKLSQPTPLARQTLQQIEQGILGKLADGTQKLELQLTPSELGAVTLILTSGKGGEISATIRSERSETAELVARHLDIIRVSLEEQGLKVDKLEVQNQSLNNRDNWQGAEQHNAMREGQERRDNLERLRRLGRLGGDGALQARDVQLQDQTAEIAEHGLHLVA
jgi:flagellar hook-length control protein FliK